MKTLKKIGCTLTLFFLVSTAAYADEIAISSPIVDTGQTLCYDDAHGLNACPKPESPFFGQDAQYQGNAPTYQDNGDGTISDLVTGLTWSRAVDAQKVSLEQAHEMAKEMTLGGYTGWRVPSIKELYSLINFSGYTGSPNSLSKPIPFINTDYFNFKYGNTQAGERYIDAQWLSSTPYVSTTMNGAQTLFGVNFADGRIKGYGYSRGNNDPREKKFYVRFVWGEEYGKNKFEKMENATILDHATGLTWMADDSGSPMTWQDALAYAKESVHGGNADWRLPNAKELQFIVDYTRSPDTSNSAAIDPLFTSSPITNEAGQADYPCYWTSTTHLDGPRPGGSAVYVAFGRAMGQMHGQTMDVHGAGAQRSDPKTGQPALGHGPQGDAVRIKNYVRLVRGGDVIPTSSNEPGDQTQYPFVSTIDKGYEADTSQGAQSNSGLSRQPGRSNSSGQSPPRGQKSKGPGGKNFVERLDQDGDSRVSRSEFHGPPAHFNRFDSNRDGYITRDEAPKGPPPKG